MGTKSSRGEGITIQLEDMWAKTQPRQSVETHSKVSGIVAQQLLQYMLPKGSLRLLAQILHLALHELYCFVGYFVSTHDIGKICKLFQAIDEITRRKMTAEGIRIMQIGLENYPRHEKNSAAIMERIWKAEGMEKRTARFLAALLGAHHQGKTGDLDKRLDAWKDWQDELERRLRRYFYGDTAVVWPVIAREDRGAVGALLLGITILSDWISSENDIFAEADQWKANLRETVEERMQAFLRDSGLEKQTLLPASDFPSVWANIPRQGMRPLQQEIESIFADCDEKLSLVLLEAPMGEGKTEAGMYAALQMAKQWEKAGFYVALPTAATSNQMVSRMRTLLNMHHAGDKVRLLHAMAWLVDEQQPNPEEIQTEDEAFARQWLAPLRRGLLSPYAVGTVDQAMQSVMMIKYGVLRLLGLSGKALVIDELHAYDVYMSSILSCLMQWCKALEIPVVLLSATLPPAKKQQMLAPFTNEPLSGRYPAVTAVTESGRLMERHFNQTVMRRRLTIRLCQILHEPDRIADKAMELVENGGCLCVLLNTVAQAQQVYQELKKRNADRALLFHARFPAGRRDEIETQCLRLFGKDKACRPKKAIVVATQVCEQSLDLDFDIMMTAIAPIDLLLQRTGREQRHPDTQRPAQFKQPTLYVLVPKDKGEVPLEQKYGADGVVYPPCLLAQSEYLLAGRQEIRIPEDMAQLVADGYDASKAPGNVQEAWMEQAIEDSIQAQAGDNMTLDDPHKKFRPASEQLLFDDLERDSFLSAKTRLGEPSVRIALLEAELYARVRQCATRDKEALCAPVRDKTLARAVLEQSVSIRKKLLKDYQSDLSVIEGRKLLDMVRIYPAEGGCYTAPDGKQIVFDRELGVLMMDGEK